MTTVALEMHDNMVLKSVLEPTACHFHWLTCCSIFTPKADMLSIKQPIIEWTDLLQAYFHGNFKVMALKCIVPPK